MKSLAEELKEINRKKKADSMRAKMERDKIEDDKAKIEANELWPQIQKELPTKLRKANANGRTHLDVLVAKFDIDFTKSHKFSRTDWHLYRKLIDWAQANGFTYRHIKREYSYDYDYPERLTFYWHEI